MPRSPVRAFRDAPVAAHMALLAVLIVVTIVIGGWRGVTSSDEGAYLVQAKQLDDGGWAVAYPYQAQDPGYHNGPFFNGEVTDRGVYLFGARPAYPAVVAGAYRVGGLALVRVLAVLGSLLGALAAWALARRLAPGRELLAFWVAGLGPLLAAGTMIWAHGLSAAAAGGAVLAALRARDRPTAGALVVLGACTAIGALLRTEGTIIAGAIAVASVLVLPGARRGLVAAAALGGGLAGYGAQRLLWRAVESGTVITVETTKHADRIHRLGSAIWRDLLSGGFLDRGAEVIGFVAAVCIVLGIVLRSRGRSTGDMAFVLAAALGVMRVVIAPGDVATGLLAGWPIILLVIFGIRWAAADEPVRFLGVTAAVFALVVIATDYEDGGGFQWAGRYFGPLIVPVAALAAVALPELAPRVAARWSARARTGAVAALIGLPALLAITSTVQVRRDNLDLVDTVARVDARVVVSTIPSLPRLAWDTYPDVQYLLARTDADVTVALQVAAAGAPPTIGLVGPTSPPALAGYRTEPIAGVAQLWRLTKVSPP